MFKNLVPVVLLFLVLSSLGLEADTLDARLSSAVAINRTEPGMADWLAQPGRSSVEGFVRFDSDLPSDVVFGIDQEFVEGVQNPLWVSGGDWMGLVGLQRNGTVFVAAGTAQTMQGIPSTERNWQILSLGQALQPDTWYRLHTEIDFANRRFVSFSVEGAGINQVIDLSAYTLDYPNYIPFDERGLGQFVFAMRGKQFATGSGAPVVYFDDVSAEIYNADGSKTQVLGENFEGNKDVKKQPLSGPPIKLENYQPGQWYFENDNAIANIESQAYARSGDKVMALNATLDVIPEPTSMMLFGAGLAAVVVARKRARKA